MTSSEEKENLVDNEYGENKEEKTGNPESQVQNAIESNDQENKDKENKGDKEIAGKFEGKSSDSYFDIGKFILGAFFEVFGSFLFIVAVLIGASAEAAIICFFVVITIISPFSGGHVNPAVTFAFYIYDFKLLAGIPKLILYTLAQLGGGALALYYVEEVKESDVISIFKQDIDMRIWVTEFFFTGTFIFVILYSCSKITGFHGQRVLTCGLIASWLYYAATSAGKRGVGSLNPAILTIQTVYNNHVYYGYFRQHKSDFWYTILAHYCAALFFTICLLIVEKVFPDSEKEKAETAKSIDENKDKEAAIDVKS